MNESTADNPVQWLFLDLNAFFASCEQQENPALRGKPVIVVQTPTDTAVAIAASYAAKGFGIKTGSLVRDARQLCPDVITVQANHRLYTDYHERILKAVDTCMPVEKVGLTARNWGGDRMVGCRHLAAPRPDACERCHRVRYGPRMAAFNLARILRRSGDRQTMAPGSAWGPQRNCVPSGTTQCLCISL
jgi:hypothetical protein